MAAKDLATIFLRLEFADLGGISCLKVDNRFLLSHEYCKCFVKQTITNSDLDSPCFEWRPCGKLGLLKTESVLVIDLSINMPKVNSRFHDMLVPLPCHWHYVHAPVT